MGAVGGAATSTGTPSAEIDGLVILFLAYEGAI